MASESILRGVAVLGGNITFLKLTACKSVLVSFKWVVTKSYKVGQWSIPIITKALFQNAELSV